MSDILIFTASYGGGHWQASRALAKALNLCQENFETEIVDFVELISPVLNKVTRYTYVQSVRNTPYLYGYFYRMTDHLNYDLFIRTQFTNSRLHKIIDFLTDHSPKLIIATYSMAAGVISYLKKKGLINIPLVTVITDNTAHSQWVHSETDLYLTSSEQVRQGLISLGVPDSKIAVTGIPIDPKFANLPPRSVLLQKFGLVPDLPVVLLMTGAEGLLRGIPPLCRMLDESPFPFQVLVVTGKDKQLYHQLQEITPEFTKLFKIYQFVDNVEEFMAVANLLITKAGGLTMSEALAVGLPMIIYRPIPGQEMENTRYLVESKAAYPVDDLMELGDTLELVFSQKHCLENLRDRALAAGRPDAARTAASIISALIARSFNSDEFITNSNLAKIPNKRVRV